MDLLSSIELPHWLMIVGAVLVAIGCLGLVFVRNRQAANSPDPEPEPRSQMPPLPSSSPRKGNI
jgi:hypothetical protein